MASTSKKMNDFLSRSSSRAKVVDQFDQTHDRFDQDTERDFDLHKTEDNDQRRPRRLLLEDLGSCQGGTACDGFRQAVHGNQKVDANGRGGC